MEKSYETCIRTSLLKSTYVSKHETGLPLHQGSLYPRAFVQVQCVSRYQNPIKFDFKLYVLMTIQALLNFLNSKSCYTFRTTSFSVIT